jgi:hypothetical protein
MNRSTAIGAVLSGLAFAGSFALDAQAAEAPAKGARRLYRDAGGLEWCVNVITLDTGVDGRPWVWFGFAHDPRRVEHVPSDVLGPECPANTSSAGTVPLKSTPVSPPRS